MGPFSFEPRLVTTLAAVALVALLLSLGRWQVNRGHEKEARQVLLDARLAEPPLRLTGNVASADPLLYRRAVASGQWRRDGQVFIDNQIREGRAGFAVVTPLEIRGSGAVVLVNRGWIARGPDYPRPPAVAVPEGPVDVSGIASLPPARFLELSSEVVDGNVWQNLSIERYRTRTGITVLPVVLYAKPADEGLQPTFERPDTGVARHQEYALTWFSLAATTFVLWIVLNLRRVR
jgi:surfeit locus 1 family protein